MIIVQMMADKKKHFWTAYNLSPKKLYIQVVCGIRKRQVPSKHKEIFPRYVKNFLPGDILDHAFKTDWTDSWTKHVLSTNHKDITSVSRALNTMNWRTVKQSEKATLRLHSILLLPVGLYWHTVPNSNLVKRTVSLVQHSYFFKYFVRFRCPPWTTQPEKMSCDQNDLVMLITCSILISSTKPSVPCTPFSYPNTKIQIYIFSLCLIIIISSHCLGVLGSQTEHGGNAAAKAISSNKAHSQSHV